ncbi:MAG: class I tRNA ligase family protein [Bacteroidetes bacterium]|nr:class I tRNA ligase family protein [Bacteroidota bacterium]
MEYNFRSIEKKWQAHWRSSGVYQVSNQSTRPKYYVLDMFPYPSGAGLHVGHPLGYIASDIFSRYKRLHGFNVLHPMGYDAFGLPAEQYAIEHGVHPDSSTRKNIDTFRAQLDNIGFCYDWNREVRTCEPEYYQFTQWIFLQLFNSFYNRTKQKAQPILLLKEIFAQEGNQSHVCPADEDLHFTAAEWTVFSEKEQEDILMKYRLAFCGYGEVNWCEALGTVLANDEVVNGVSERGGHPVVKKMLRQWYLRITEYADRLLEGLETIDFSDAMKEMQSNWIGKSYGAEISFALASGDQPIEETLTVYTTRPDTIFGVDFMVVAPEHPAIEKLITSDTRVSVENYISYVKSRSDRERQAEKKISGCFSGGYAIHPFTGKKIPVWIAEYVLIGYGTGAIMGVPCGDDRDFRFAQHSTIPITNIIGEHFNGTAANATKDAVLQESDFLNGIVMRDAIPLVLQKITTMGIGRKKVNYKMRDASFSRQRYWGEPFPIRWDNGIARPLDAAQLPLLLPQVETYQPGPDGEGPLANIPEWVNEQYETNTMPGYAGSSWYFLRYMDPHNRETFCSREASDYWNQVDLYIGGTEHAVGHLLYSRFWTKVMFDLGHIGFQEPFKKLLNQGMIQGSSRFMYRLLLTADKKVIEHFTANIMVSNGYRTGYESGSLGMKALLDIVQQQVPDTIFDASADGILFQPIHVDVNFVDGFELNMAALQTWRNGEYAAAAFVLEDGKYTCGAEVEKMSKSKFNTVNPDELVEKYGADTFRMYEMFLGPVDQSKPWDTKGIEGVHRFVKKLWRLFFDEQKGSLLTQQAPTAAELKVLHKTIKKIADDTERFSFNTAVSTFMIAVNELSDLQCHSAAILEPFLILLTPYAPHVSEELWSVLGHTDSILDASFPIFEAQYVAESAKEYPVSVNGKVRANILINLDASEAEVQEMVMQHPMIIKWMEDKPMKKFIFVKGRMVNVVV